MAAKQLSPEILKNFETVLHREKEETLRILETMTSSQKMGAKEASGDLSSYSLHQADQGTDTVNMETQAYLFEEQQKKLKQLNLALKRIYDKNYGVCEICGELISEARLKILPYAHYCIECQAKEEKKKQ